MAIDVYIYFWLYVTNNKGLTLTFFILGKKSSFNDKENGF
jgi:hypothetical protein